jgi:hypothetical protein
MRPSIDFGLICLAPLMTLAIAVTLTGSDPEWTPVPFLTAP